MPSPDDALVRAMTELRDALARDAAPATIAELAVASGALVESGASPVVGIDVLLDALARAGEVLAALGPTLADVDLDTGVAEVEVTVAQRAWIGAFRRLVVGAMARLARSVDARHLARRHPRLGHAIRALAAERDAWHLFYLVEVLEMLDDASLHLVDTAAGTVSRLRATGIRNNFHLMTLLEGVDPFALAPDSTAGTSRGYYTWRYFTVTSGLARDLVTTMIPGAARATELPAFGGTRVVVRTPTGVHRSWEASFVTPIHDALGATVVIESELPAADAADLLARMAVAR